jgi:hypothetical protein
MIWLEFHKQGNVDSAAWGNVVLAAGPLNIEVHTRPPVDGLTVTGVITVDGQKIDCEFQPVANRAGVYSASFEPGQPGLYQITVTAGGAGYREFTLSGELYCRW